MNTNEESGLPLEPPRAARRRQKAKWFERRRKDAEYKASVARVMRDYGVPTALVAETLGVTTRQVRRYCAADWEPNPEG